MNLIQLAGIVLLPALAMGMNRPRSRSMTGPGRYGATGPDALLESRAKPAEPARAPRSMHVHNAEAYLPAAPANPEDIAALLQPGDILLDMDVADRQALFGEIGRHMEQRHGLAHAWVENSLARREQAGSTGLGDGFAIPHARVKELERIHICYGALREPIAFDAPDGKPVSDLLVLLVPKQATEAHLHILADATRMFSDPQFRQSLLLCRHAADVKRLFDDWRPLQLGTSWSMID